MKLFHIAVRATWEDAAVRREYRAPSLADEGFIHLSEERQWRRVFRERFSGRDDLVLLAIDRDRLGAELRYEAADGDEFPHLYGPLEVEAVVEVRRLDGDGRAAPEAT